MNSVTDQLKHAIWKLNLPIADRLALIEILKQTESK